ncbi:hypothetical protein EB077_14310 [bacterium]|nr:hypothetical protein [bacterium]
MADIRNTNIFNKMTQGLNWRQYYYDNTRYYPFDVLLYYGSCYICIQEAYNKEPTNTQYWNLMVSKGDKGDRGDNAGENSGGGGGGGSFDFGGVADIANGVATATSTAVLAAAIMFLRGEVALLWANVTALNAKTINQAAILGSTTFTGVTNFTGDVNVNNGVYNYVTMNSLNENLTTTNLTTTNLQVTNTGEMRNLNINNNLNVTEDVVVNNDLYTNNIKPLTSNPTQNINIKGFIKNT